MYRCVALAALRAGAALDDAEASSLALAHGLEIALADGRVLLDGEDVTDAIRAPEVSAAASRVSVHPGVREAMVERQRALIEAGDYVVEGRDIGTVVSPDAPLKVFLTASDSERARRRAARDRRAGRSGCWRRRPRGTTATAGASTGRCARADDATELDTTGLDVDAGRRPDRRHRPTSAGWCGDERAAAPDRRGRLPERRQVDARQPAGRGPRGGRPRARPGSPATARRSTASGTGSRFRLIDTGGVDLAAEDSLVAGGSAPGARGDRQRRRWSCSCVDARAGLRAGRRRGRRDPAPRGPCPSSWSPTRSTSPATPTWRPSSTRSGSASRCPSRPPTATAPATSSTACAASSARERRVGGSRPTPDAEARRSSAESRDHRAAANVGKSSLVNAFLGSERVIVSDHAGTTRDAIDTELELGGRRLVLVDTAGLRRRTKVAGTVAYYAQLRSERAAERADVALVVCDASEGVTSEDLRVAELAMKSGLRHAGRPQQVGHRARRTWTTRPRGSTKRLRQRPPVIACSASRGRGVPKLLERAVQLADRRASRIATSELNRFVGDLVASRPPPSKAGRRLRALLRRPGRTAGRRRFAIQVNDRRLITPRVGVLPREPAPGGVRAGGRPAGDRLRAPTRARRAGPAAGIAAPSRGRRRTSTAVTRRCQPSTSGDARVARRSRRYARRHRRRFVRERSTSASRRADAAAGPASDRPAPRRPSPPAARTGDCGRGRRIQRGRAAPAETGRELVGSRWSGSHVDLHPATARAGGGRSRRAARVWFVAVPALPCGPPAATSARRPTTRSTWCPTTRSPTCTSTSTPAAISTRRPQSVAARVPTLARQAIGRLLLARASRAERRALDFARDVAPVVRGRGGARRSCPPAGRPRRRSSCWRSADEARASEFADSLAAGTPRTSDYRDVQVERRPARAGHRARRRVPRDRDHERGAASDRRPERRRRAPGRWRTTRARARRATRSRPSAWPTAYLSTDGIARLVADPGGPLAALDAAVDPAASAGVAAALVADDRGLELEIRSILDRARAPRPSPGSSPPSPRSSPRSPARSRRTRSATSGSASRARADRSLPAQASANEPGLAAAVAALVQGVKQLGSVDLETDLLPSLGQRGCDRARARGVGRAASPYLLRSSAAGVDAAAGGQGARGPAGPVAEALDASQARRRAFSEQQGGRRDRAQPAGLPDGRPHLRDRGRGPGGRHRSRRGRGAVRRRATVGDDEPFKAATAGLPSEVSTARATSTSAG